MPCDYQWQRIYSFVLVIFVLVKTEFIVTYSLQIQFNSNIDYIILNGTIPGYLFNEQIISFVLNT